MDRLSVSGQQVVLKCCKYSCINIRTYTFVIYLYFLPLYLSQPLCCGKKEKKKAIARSHVYMSSRTFTIVLHVYGCFVIVVCNN